MSGQPGHLDNSPRRQSRPQSTFDPTIPAMILGIIIVVVAAVFAFRTLFAAYPSDLLAELGDGVAASGQSGQSGEDAGEAEAEVLVDTTDDDVSVVAPTLTSATIYSWADDDGDHPELVSALVDGDPTTQWRSRYFNDNVFAEGSEVAILLTLAEPATVSEIDLNIAGQGGEIVVRNASEGHPRIGDVLATATADGDTVIKLPQPEEVSALGIVFTTLPVDDEGMNRAKISAVTVK